MSFLSAELLAAIHKRAARHDRDNSFPEDDLNDLRTAGYLSAFVPKEFNGAGLSVERICAEQTALAKAAPATALAINMHQIIVGMARYLVAHGNDKGRQVLHDAAAGELFGFGISEPGNDLVLFGSISKAVPDGEGGFSFHGTKVFTSLAPAWTRLLTFGTDDSGDDGPHSVFAILYRDDGGFYVKPRLGHPGHARHPVEHDGARRSPRPRRPGARPHHPRPERRSGGLRHLLALLGVHRRHLPGHRRARHRGGRRAGGHPPQREE
ncbi:Acyl-CoA dehydrogenase [Propionibacterium freudenreichii subsp. freudenreichii]|uniref:Acyl-CoA dehydrogenase n=1 Tax=Propionibacterium freudenreichii subsp. freudenreichii TaxID=66712 RepID=A0A0B7NZ93_PROFF|nr:Acyl-CoA dehydrogenase [Propionibacterium freudenreichii subsp. freudenreichii]